MQRREIPAGEKRYDLARMRSERDVDGLIEASQNSDPAIRRGAVESLGALGKGRAVDPLIRALTDPVQGVREGAANALVMVGKPAVEPLIDLLERPEAAAEYRLSGEASGEGLTQVDLLGGPKDLPPTKRVLQHRGGITQHDLLGGPEGVKEHEALFPGAKRAGIVKEGGPPGTGPGLRRAYAAAILGEIADPRAERALTRSLSDSDPGVRRAAEDGMRRFRERRGETTPVSPIRP